MRITLGGDGLYFHRCSSTHIHRSRSRPAYVCLAGGRRHHDDDATFLRAKEPGGPPKTCPYLPKLLRSFRLFLFRLISSCIDIVLFCQANNSYQFIIAHAPNHNETTNSYMFGLSGHRPGALRPPIGACICSASWHYCRREPVAAADTIFINPPIDGGRGWDRKQGGGGQRRTYQDRRARIGHLRSG